MEPAALQMWRWLAFACFSWTCLGQVASVPYYIVTIPAVLEAGAGSRFCLSLLRPNETLQMTVTLMSEDENITLFQQTSDKQFRHKIINKTTFFFQVPKVQNSVQELEVILQGQDFVMKEVRKVMIKSYNPQTFIQTDKPIYLPGQTGNFRCVFWQVSMSPLISSDYTLTPLAGAQQASCLCAKGRRTHSWKLTPTALGPVNVTMIAEAVSSHTSCDNEIVNVPERGRIDVVTRSLIVKAEGTEQTKTHNILLCPKGESLQEKVELSLPEDMIQGSARASVSVLGDILGRALKNLDGLLSMPYGCGEQNMALLAPNIYILEYLTNTQQITSKIKARATNFLTSGYQRQLNYKHSDGAYSTFGTGSGNTWLTAFVLRSFVKAKSFIYIDPTILADAKSWLESKQQDNGCFQKLGSLFNNRMKGGVSDEVTLSAYVTAALLETNMSVSDPQINKSMSCLRQSLGDKSNTYATSLLAYVFTLAGDMEARTLLLEHLDKVATQEGGNLYWSQRSEKSMSLSVEISSYVLLATLSATPTTADLGYASRIVRWLTSQQNSYGGFSSTQDTVVALQALALYSTLVFSPEGSSTVDVQLPSGQMTFEVNQDNKLLYQERSMKDVTGKYSVVVKGTACASMQLSLHYNIPTPRDESSFRIKVTPDSECSTNQLRPKVTLRLEYVGKEDSTNMVMVDIKLLSGFSALLVDRVEHNDDHVIIYLKPVSKLACNRNTYRDIYLKKKIHTGGL
uniref:Alpha-2-macroglobulin-like n=1 Tax=Gadus morhua TaxID=8049 RepID=A0A8C4YYU5_GADMO